MPYRTIIRPFLARQIRSWGLSDFVWTEVYLRLRETLPAAPHANLRRVQLPFDGMVYSFGLVDPENRLCEHLFIIQVLYGQDEATLHAIRGGYRRTVGI